MRLAAAVLIAVWAFGPVRALAQDSQTLADIRQELTVLYVEVQKLQRELSTTGGPTLNLSGSSVLDRVTAMEAELQRLTARTEQLQYRVDQVVRDGTNRIGDLEFRLVELEGGDVSKLGETTTLGGETETPAPQVGAVTPAPQDPSATGELAVGERADLDAAIAALETGEFQTAVSLMTQFNQAYPGSPLASEANLQLGKAHEGLGDTRSAARSYLASFTADTTGPTAPDALYHLGASLGDLGQVEQACVTLGEVGVRFPTAPATLQAREKMTELSCP